MNYDQQCNQYKKKLKKTRTTSSHFKSEKYKKKDHDCMTLEINVIAFDKKCFCGGILPISLI